MNNTYFAPSVHCSYCSVLQLMKFTVSEAMGISYKDQDEQINQLKQNRASAKGTHEYLINKIGEEIRKIKKQEYPDFIRKIKDLKTSRTKGDYENVMISSEQSQKAYGLANELRKQLKKTFRV
ncbi:MAG: hypothetical protein EOM83_11345 [Clostridia bacterium]|nr:hypothetical protein [Clostridia bacterium]